MRVHLLGEFRVDVGGHAVDASRWRLNKARTVVKLLAEGSLAEAEAAVALVLREDPLHEPALRALMRVLAAAGRRSAALQRYERARDDLRSAYGTDPDPESRQLYRDLLFGSADTAQPGPPAGEGNLPPAVTSFVGRTPRSPRRWTGPGRSRPPWRNCWPGPATRSPRWSRPTWPPWSDRPGPDAGPSWPGPADGRSCYVEPDLPPARATPAVPHQVLDVLVTNALGHGARPGHRHGPVRRRRAGRGRVDEGDGSDPATRPAAFRRGNPHARGTGIGLGLARGLIESIGGRLVIVEPGPRPVSRLLLGTYFDGA